ncbi:MAG: CaiB/BaiF CoA transferase family protein [Pseudooceanicola sp.]
MPNDAPLARFRILELGSGDALSYCGKIFADFGAEVIKVEPPGGDPRRSDGVQAGGSSAYFAWLNTNKISVTADWRSDAGADTIRTLLKACDLMIDGRSQAEVDGSSLDHATLQENDPGLGIVGLTWFGPDGIYRDYKGTEAVARSLAGLVWDTGPIDGVPMLAREGQAVAIAGMTAFVPGAAILWDRKNGGRRYALGIHPALTQISEYDIMMQLDVQRKPRRGVNRFSRTYPCAPYPTKDGWLGVTVITPQQWETFCQIIERPDLSENPKYDSAVLRMDHMDELDPIIEECLVQKTAAEWFELGLARKVPLAIIPAVGDLKDLAFHRERKSFGTVTSGDATFDAPILPMTLTDTPPIRDGIAPAPGSTTADAIPARARKVADKRAEGLPLRGIRILDMTMGWAGPISVRQLADLGADVVKVESLGHPDWFRGTDPRPPYHAERMYERHAPWQIMNRNKRGITLDIASPEGRELILELAKTADLAVDSYAADAMPKFGLTADVLQGVNPNLNVVTMPAFGMATSWRNGRAYGTTLEHASGIPMVNGRPEDPPSMCHSVFGDAIGGLTGAAAMMVAMLARETTGKGQHVDLAQVQGILPLFAETIIEHSVTGHARPRSGNTHVAHFPYGCFKCSGVDQFLTIEVRTTDEWRGLCQVMRRPDLGEDPTLATLEGRRARGDEITEAVNQWASLIRASSAMDDLQAHGVPAGVARAPIELPLDPHLMSIGRYEAMVRPFIGGHIQPVSILRENGADRGLANRCPSPTLGQHNREVLIGELGLSEEYYDALKAARIVGDRATKDGSLKVEWPDGKRRTG